MKIIQSFAKFDEGSPYSNNKKAYLNFYTFLLSYLTLNKYYGHVTMICNQSAYDDIIKYIPYDDIIIAENKNSFHFWSAYKLDAIKLIDDDIIHVDSDVFIFDNIFDEFILSKKYDIIVQDLIKWKDNSLMNFITGNSEFLIDNDIINPEIYDGRFTSCGVLGMKKGIKEVYINAVDKTYDAMKNKKLKNLLLHQEAMILEELTLYLIPLEHKYNIYDILSTNLPYEIDNIKAGNLKKYSHMWFGSKFDDKYVNLIIRKIRTEFSRHGFRINKYEADLIKQGIIC